MRGSVEGIFQPGADVLGHSDVEETASLLSCEQILYVAEMKRLKTSMG